MFSSSTNLALERYLRDVDSLHPRSAWDLWHLQLSLVPLNLTHIA